jgi:hypothetical protein
MVLAMSDFSTVRKGGENGKLENQSNCLESRERFHPLIHKANYPTIQFPQSG